MVLKTEKPNDESKRLQTVITELKGGLRGGDKKRSDNAENQLEKIAENTSDPLILCEIADHTQLPSTLDGLLRIIERWDDELMAATVAGHIARSNHTHPVTLDKIAKDLYPPFVKMEIAAKYGAFRITLADLIKEYPDSAPNSAIGKEARETLDYKKGGKGRNGLDGFGDLLRA